ncbi:hypothetical protein [Mycobacteroides abscessus]|uniref:hypothetical protein n=1 Tax=Mycobacteroides abscessus TaxID=36809 RepID=UPI00092ACF29|nr:hypothetical protein [Mycobacteroides abscessus]SHX64808.1 Uncharacterised protein [Mycobacteroides abscessus subsp. abscessus]SHZ18141.1 Uncharacterised protein [Mycobacteroides abscessus subsp. abscessus]SIB51015.1 Uncharacterised protein [Mycobacteroides abscessus subsp. abscessus]SIF18569.1 Uncharacterised protein [Mycobacteroides abscessus subsp. abscessus]SKI48285.1 Uncharacterised protein [Mycobacteroides abscessus subsp. abscessus]
MSPTPTPAPGWDCITLLPIPPQPHRCAPESTVADLGQGTGAGLDSAMDSARDLANAPADPAHTAALHNLIYPQPWWADLSTVQLIGIGAVLIVLTALMVAVLARRQGGAA